MNKVRHYQLFKKKTEKRLNELKQNYQKKMDDAQDEFKLSVHNRFWDDFSRREFQSIQNKLGPHNRFFIEIKDIVGEHKRLRYDQVFNKKIVKVPLKTRASVKKLLVELQSIDDFLSYLRVEGKKYNIIIDKHSDSSNPETNQATSNIFWKSQVELDFIILIYSLFEAGVLSNNENEITALVKQVASFFNLSLGSNWQSNLSNNISNSNLDYVPGIVKIISSGYTSYKKRILNKKNKPK